MAVERLEAVPFVVVVFSLKVFADAARRKKVKRLSFSTAEKKKRKKKKMKTPLSLSLSLSLSKKTKTKTKTRTKGLFLLVLSSSFFCALRGAWKKGRRGLSKGRRNEEKACGSLNVLSFFRRRVSWLFFVAEKQLLKNAHGRRQRAKRDFLVEPLFRLR